MLVTPEVKRLLNSLKCPICKAGIDLLGSAWTKYNGGYDFSCAFNNQHYSLLLKSNVSPTSILAERVYVYDGNKKYQLNKTYLDTGATTEIIIFKVDPEGREMFVFEQKRLFLNKDLFDFANFNHEKAIQRIKNILLLH